jgi:LAO/AO transport system kinase
VVVPESGDEIQTMKAGLMEIADVFVVNKSDRPDADAFVKNLRMMLAPTFSIHKEKVEVIKTIANEGKGLTELAEAIEKHLYQEQQSDKQNWLLTERVWKIIEAARMKDINKKQIAEKIKTADRSSFNLYRFAKEFY